MKKNKILYLIFTIIIIFGCNSEVFAAKELTCLYNNDKILDFDTRNMILIQNSDGSIEIYKSKKGTKLEEAGWKKYSTAAKKAEFKDGLKKGKLTECPKSEKRNDGIPIFYANYGDGKRDLTKQYNEIKRPNVYANESSTKKYAGKSCDSIKENKWIEPLDENKYTAACLYENDTTNGCNVIQININKDGTFKNLQEEPLDSKFVVFEVDGDSLNINTITDGGYEGACPIRIYVKRNTTWEQGFGYQVSTTMRLSEKNGYVAYENIGVDGNNLKTGEELSMEVEIPLNFEKLDILNCEQLFGNSDDLINMIKWVITVIKVLIPIVLIGLGIVDFAQAVFAGNEDKMKKAQAKFIKRLIIGIAIFLIPSLLKLILGIANSIWPNIDADLCGII